MTHEHDDQSRRTLGATVAKCPELVTPDLDRVRCSCGQPRPTDAGTDLVREYARLSLVVDAAQLDKHAIGYRTEPSGSATDTEWAEFVAWKRREVALSARYSAAFSECRKYVRANLAALKAALGVSP